MFAAGKWALSIVAGGLTLGALLGDAADPRMKDPVPQWWQLTGQHAIVPSSDHAFFEAGPEDLNPYNSYRPDLDYDAEVGELPIPAYEMAVLEEPMALEEDLPRVSYGVEAAEVAEEAAAVVTEALAAEAPVEAAPRQSQLAAAGIY